MQAIPGVLVGEAMTLLKIAVSIVPIFGRVSSWKVFDRIFAAALMAIEAHDVKRERASFGVESGVLTRCCC